MSRIKQPLNKSLFRHAGETDRVNTRFMSLRGAEGDAAIDYNQLFTGLLCVARSDVSKFSHSQECQHPVNNGFYWIMFITLITWLLVINTPFVFAATGRILEGIEAEQADKAALVAEANIFKSIGMGIALSLAQCEGQDQCQVIDADEIEQLLNTLDERIDNLILRQGGGEGEYTEVLTAYIDQREKYLKYQDKLEEIVGIPEAADNIVQDDKSETEVFGADDQQGGVDLSIFEDVDEGLGGDAGPGADESFEDEFSPEDP